MRPGDAPAAARTGPPFDGAEQADRALCSLPSPTSLLVRKILHAVLQIVGQRDFGDRRFDRDLQARPIDVAQRALDHAVILLVGIDHDALLAVSAVMRTFWDAPRPAPPADGRRRRREVVLAACDRKNNSNAAVDRVPTAAGAACRRRRSAGCVSTAVEQIEPRLGALTAGATACRLSLLAPER